jgi:hypothetical protein
MSRYATPELRQTAQQVMADLRDSVSIIWDGTVPDANAKPADRAERLRRAFADNADSETTVQAIASAMKGSPFTGPADPRLPAIRLALNDSNARVRLAAGYAMLGSNPGSADDINAAIKVLEDLRANGPQPAYKSDACALLFKWNSEHDR